MVDELLSFLLRFAVGDCVEARRAIRHEVAATRLPGSVSPQQVKLAATSHENGSRRRRARAARHNMFCLSSRRSSAFNIRTDLEAAFFGQLLARQEPLIICAHRARPHSRRAAGKEGLPQRLFNR